MTLKLNPRLTVLTAAFLLCGCASSGLIYPSTSGIDTIERKTLSPSEQKAVIDDLQGTNATGANEPQSLIKATSSLLPQ